MLEGAQVPSTRSREVVNAAGRLGSPWRNRGWPATPGTPRPPASGVIALPRRSRHVPRLSPDLHLRLRPFDGALYASVSSVGPSPFHQRGCHFQPAGGGRAPVAGCRGRGRGRRRRWVGQQVAVLAARSAGDGDQVLEGDQFRGQPDAHLVFRPTECFTKLPAGERKRGGRRGPFV